MTSKQQEEALSYFQVHVSEWQRRAHNTDGEKFDVNLQRVSYVLQAVQQEKDISHLLDVGCGTGDLVCEAAKLGISALGVDFAEEMIRRARERAARDNCKLADFRCCSIFDLTATKSTFDMISANGFVEYIAPGQLDDFLVLASSTLRAGGHLILSSRNRLLNLFTLNDFTVEEIQEGNVVPLLAEAVAWAQHNNQQELAAIEPIREPGSRRNALGISTYQYTPVQLIRILMRHKFSVTDVYPIHIHAVVPRFKDKYPGIHKDLATLLQSFAAENLELMPYASTFMVHAKVA